MTTLILGGGFGLYGHAAALVSMGEPVLLPERYRAVVEQRQDLEAVRTAARWTPDEVAAMAAADRVVFARRPADNEALARATLRLGERAVVIEKPPAATPSGVADLADAFDAADRSWSTPYLLGFCSWAGEAADAVLGGRRVEMTWAYPVSPTALEWKRDAAQGGGALAFYFIHAIALGEQLCPSGRWRWAPSKSAVSCDIEAASGGSMQLAFATVADQPAFGIAVDGRAVFSAVTPFGAAPQRGAPDPRIAPLTAFYRSIAVAPQTTGFHRAIARHWADASLAGPVP